MYVNGWEKKTNISAKLFSSYMYDGLDNVEFPVTVNGFRTKGSTAFYVLGSELIRVGADPDAFEPDFPYCFSNYEVV